MALDKWKLHGIRGSKRFRVSLNEQGESWAMADQAWPGLIAGAG